MRFGILGPLDIRTADGTPLDPGGPRPRALLTLLLLDAGHAVPTDRLTAGLYGDRPPAGAANALQSQISRLRRRLAPHAEIAATPTGYRLAVPADSVDAHRFERLARDGHTALVRGEHPEAAALLREALALWRGPALTDLPDAHPRLARLDELRLTAVQDRVDADLALGGGPELVAELRALLAARPLGERLYGQLMRALHAGGRTAEALTVYEEARRALADELGADPSAELSALHVELLRGTGSGPVAERRPPAQLTSFVGRAAELRRVGDLLARNRLVTLTGPGGVGKTRLAVEAARSRELRDAVCYVELAALTEGARVPYAVLAALGVREGLRRPVTDSTERLLAALRERELLLVLDNCEHLVEDVARVTGLLLGACPGVRVLATGRESLGITGEVLCPVAPLTPEPAARLFVDRAAAVRPGFAGHARVAEICAALDGLPLAVELAAARLRTLTPDELADRLAAHLDDRFRLLGRGDRTKEPRHRTLRAVVEWSWDLLDDEERELARRLAVFSSGATLEAAEAVCGVPYPEDLLASLAEKSFLEVTDGRYGMLGTLRAFAAEHLVRAGEERRLRDAHAGYFRRLAERAEPHLRGAGQLPWLDRLDAEQGNLDAALRHVVRTGPEDALRLMAALSWYWRLRGLYGAQVPLARALLTAVGDEPPEGLAEEYALCVINTLSPDGLVGDGGGHAGTGDGHAGTGDGHAGVGDGPVGDGDPPAGAGDGPADEWRLARVETVLASLDGPLRLPFTIVLWSVAGGPLPATDRVRAQAGGSPWARALLDVGLAYQALFAGRPEESETVFTRALAGFRTTGDRWGTANCLDTLTALADRRGDLDRALALADEGLRHVRELAAPEETADLLRTRATVLLHRGERAEAAADFGTALRLARTAGLSDKTASARRGLGDAARLGGDTVHARVHYEKALQECAANWFSAGESAHIAVGLGRTALAEGDAEEARGWFRQAAAFAAESPGGLELAVCAEASAAVAGTPERAAVLLGAAVTLRGAPHLGDPEVVRTGREVRSRLSPEAYERAFARGHELGAAALTENPEADQTGQERSASGRRPVSAALEASAHDTEPDHP
ncbi:ATP-binding protein [Streptomyces sp. NPDC059786]|uniref:ATP-binding protein n=1 Tax=Streptomyces sp. NPDC059786 TaxID=3346946 RepID=UPI0036615C6D